MLDRTRLRAEVDVDHSWARKSKLPYLWPKLNGGILKLLDIVELSARCMGSTK